MIQTKLCCPQSFMRPTFEISLEAKKTSVFQKLNSLTKKKIWHTISSTGLNIVVLLTMRPLPLTSKLFFDFNYQKNTDLLRFSISKHFIPHNHSKPFLERY